MTTGIYTRPYVQQYPTLLTYRDLLDRVIEYSNAGVTQPNLRAFRIAVDEAYRDLAYCNIWKYLSGEYSLALVAPVDDGTIAYDHTGGSSERLVTLTDSTWPSWALYGHLRVGNTFYDVEKVLSSTTLMLSVANNPGVDIAAGTSYTLYRSCYTLPADFRAMHKGNVPNAMWASTYIEPDEWFRLERRTAAAGNPRCWTIMADPRLSGSYAIFLWPHPSTANTYAFIYNRKPRDLLVSGYNAATDSVGTVACSASTTVTGTSTNFTQALVGTVFRFGTASAIPDGYVGLNPYAEQRIVTAVASTTSLTLDSAPTGTYSGVKYCCSDVVDMPAGMLNALLTGIKYKYAFNRPGEARQIQMLEQAYRMAIIEARANDSIVISGRFETPFRWDRMHDHTYDPPPT